MAVIVQLLNGTNQCRDAGFQSDVSTILSPGVRKNYSGELAVTLNQVAPGQCFVQVTRDVVSPNEVFLIPIWVTANVTVDTSGNGYIIVRVDKDKVNDGSSNSDDGTGIATVEKVASLPVDDPYIILATLASGVITDARTWTQISENVLEDPLYFDEDAQATDDYVITITGFKNYKHGQEYTFEANTTNTGAATLAINGKPAKSIRKNYSSALSNGDINAGQFVTVRYDANNDWFQMLSVAATAPTALTKAVLADMKAGTDNSLYTTPLGVANGAIYWGNCIFGTFGDAVSSGDLSSFNNLMYQNPTDRKWYKVTSSADTWYNRLALAVESASIGESKKLLLKGLYDRTFSNINPTISQSGTGTDNNIGQSAANRMRSVKISNLNAPEVPITAITLSLRQQGAPSGALNVYIVLKDNNKGQAACFFDTTNNVVRGAIIASGTIPQASFSGSYQNLTLSLPFKLPGSVEIFAVLSKPGAVDASNYYQVQSAAALPSYDSSTQTWSGSPSVTANFSLTVTSTSAVGYSVKAYTGSSGSWGLTATNPWSRCIGIVESATTIFFDPEMLARKTANISNILNPQQASGMNTITSGFCPNSVNITTSIRNSGVSTLYRMYKGSIRGDSGQGSSCIPTGAGGTAGGTSTLADYLTPQIDANFSEKSVLLNVNLNGNQNVVNIVRLENGFHVYASYPDGTNFINGGNTNGNINYQAFLDACTI